MAGQVLFNAFHFTPVDLCLSLFLWAQFRRRESAVKLPTLLDLRGNILTAVYVNDGQVNVILPMENGTEFVLATSNVADGFGCVAYCPRGILLL